MNSFSRSSLACITSALFAAAVPAVIPMPAQAFALPVFENLEPKWATLTVGMTVEEVVQKIGSAPRQHDQSELVGVRVDDLSWTDIRLNKYRARFLAGRLYAKSLSHGN